MIILFTKNILIERKFRKTKYQKRQKKDTDTIYFMDKKIYYLL